MTKTAKKTSPKKKSRRAKTKYPALNSEFNLRSRQELYDWDYIDKLSDKEKEWLNTFSEEFNNANFNHGKKILHKSKLMKKDCYSKNNARNRDILTRQKAMGQHIYIEELKETEDSLKEYLPEESDDLNNSGNDTEGDT